MFRTNPVIFRLLVLSSLITGIHRVGFCADQSSAITSIPLITQTVAFTPKQAEWSCKVDLKPGPYRLTVTYGDGGVTNEGYSGFPPAPYSIYPGRGCARIRVRLDGREIATVQAPPIPSDKTLLRQIAVPFVCLAGGEQEIRLTSTLYEDDRLEVMRAELESVRVSPVPHTLLQSGPGRPLMDAISWAEYVYYTMPPPGSGPDEILDKTLRPSWKAGFNMIWTVLNNASGTIPFPWDEQATGIPMPATYAPNWKKDNRWQVEGYRRYLGYIHDRGMMEMLYWPGAFPGVPTGLAAPGQKASVIRTADKILNSLLYDERGLCDGISNERYCTTDPSNALIGSRELALAHVNQLLESNPGAYAANYISGVDSARPGMLGDMPNGLEPYSAGYFEGWDDCLLFAPDPWLLRVAGGKKYRWIEFWTEDGDLVPKDQRRVPNGMNAAVTQDDSLYHGHIGEDFIVKQMNDMSRLRLLDPDHCDALTGATWYTDGLIISDTNYEMTHAVSQDPVRAAVAGQLRTLGKGGKVRSLYPYSTSSYFIQNNYLALFLPEGETHGELFYDLQRTGNFTAGSFCVPLTKGFLDIPSPEEVAGSTSARVLERGGYRGVVQSEARLRSGQTEVRETRTFELLADTPCLTVTIEDEPKMAGLSLTNALGGEGYDELLVDGQAVEEDKPIELPEYAVLRDSSGLRPNMAVLFLEAPSDTKLVWKRGQSLALIRSASQRLRVAVAAPTDLYGQDQLAEWRKLLLQPMPVMEWKDAPMRVNNSSSLPVTRVVALNGADDRPYLVREKGWWTFRGAQVSKQSAKTDYLKIYLQPKEEALILPWGFIDGVARPGWGCQYTLALGKVRPTRDGGACLVKALGETPLVFAPRVEFAWPIEEVELDGKPWRYFDGNHVFLPQRRGEYHLRVRKGRPKMPHLTRTFANIRSTDFANGELTIQAAAPPWRPRLPEGVRLTAQIEHPGRDITRITGGKRVSGLSGKSVITIKPGTVRIRF